MRNEWLDREVESLKVETKLGKPRDYLFPYFMVMLIILLIFNTQVFCGYIQEDYSTNKFASWFPSTWICPNHRCGYENYDGIDYCALCGTRRR